MMFKQLGISMHPELEERSQIVIMMRVSPYVYFSVYKFLYSGGVWLVDGIESHRSILHVLYV